MGAPRLLIVDDLPELCELLREAFTEEGYEVIAVFDPSEARRLLGTGAFDLALIDAVLPRESGQSLADYAVKRGAAVVLMTGDAVRADAEESLGRPCLAKPFRLVDAIALVSSVLAGRRN